MISREVFESEINKTEPECREGLLALFHNAPDWLIRMVTVREYKKKECFITAGERARSVYVLLKGVAVGVEYQSWGGAYNFLEFRPGRVIGDFEVFGDIEEYNVSIKVISRSCRLFVIPKEVFKEWMQTDVGALYIRIHDVMQQLTRQLSEERKNLMMTNYDKLLWFIIRNCEISADQILYQFPYTQNQLAEYLGQSTRTLQRSLYTMRERGLISLHNGRITITMEQYRSICGTANT